MNFWKSDLFKVSIVASLMLALVFCMIHYFVMGAFSLTARVQDRNDALNMKTAAVIIKNRNIKTILKKELIKARARAVEEYIKDTVYNIQPKTIKTMAASIIDSAIKNDLPVELVVAVIHTISSFNPTLIGKNGRSGLFQIDINTVSTTDNTVPRRKLHEIRYNTEIGTKLLSKCVLTSGGDIARTLAKFKGVQTNDKFVTRVVSNLLNFTSFKTNYLTKVEQALKPKELAKEIADQMLAEAQIKK